MKVLPSYSIDIGEGFGPIKFGLKPIEVEHHLGKANEVEHVDEEARWVLMWYYSDLKLQIIFQAAEASLADPADDRVRLDQLTTGHHAATLWGIRVIGKPRDEILAVLSQKGHEQPAEWDTDLAASGWMILRLHNIRLSFDFHKGILRRVLWGALITPYWDASTE